MTETTQLTLDTSTTPDIIRHLTRSGPVYLADLPNSFDIEDQLGGFLRYSVTTDSSGRPELRIDLDPSTEDVDAAYTLGTGQPLSIPQPLVEYLTPVALSWSQTETDVSASLSLATPDRGAAAARGQGTVFEREGSYFLELPKVEAITASNYCDVRLHPTEDGYEVTVVPTDHATPAGSAVRDATSRPHIEVPELVVRALGLDVEDRIPVAVHPDGEAFATSDLVDLYEAEYGRPTAAPVDVDDSFIYTALPEPLREHAPADGATHPLSIDLDGPTVQLTVDTTKTAAADADLAVTVSDAGVTFERPLGDILGLQRHDVVWHYDDRAFIAEVLAKPAPAVPQPSTETEVESRGDQVAAPLPEEDIGTHAFDLAITQTGAGDAALTIRPGDDVEAMADGGVAAVPIPGALATALGIESGMPVGWESRDDGWLVYPGEHAIDGATSQEGSQEVTLDIPENGRNHRVRAISGSNHAASLPAAASERFDLQKGSKLQLTVEDYEGELAIIAEPIADEDVSPEVCTGRMLSGTSMKLPMQLVSALSLFDRMMTWGFDYTAEGERLVALLEPSGEPPLDEGTFVGDGETYVEENADSGNSHYYLTAPVEGVDELAPGGRPAGVIVGYEHIGGEPRYLLLPASEEDMDIPGAVSLTDHWDDDYVRFTLSKALAVSVEASEEDDISWTLVDGVLIGTVQ